MFHKFEEGWEPFDEERELNIILAKFLNEQFDYLHCGHPEFKKRVASEKSIDRTTDDVSGFKNAVIKFKNQCSQKPIRYGTSNRVIGGKALGMGIGVLIVDCLDEDIPWDDKLKMLDLQLFLLVFLAFLHPDYQLQVLSYNKSFLLWLSNLFQPIRSLMILKPQKSWAFGSYYYYWCRHDDSRQHHVSNSLLGSLFGGLLGGVGMGLYQKFLIPYYMDNIVEMMNKASRLIRQNGAVRYKQYALQKLQIDEKFLGTHKPSNLEDDQYFTLLMFCLSNEIRLISNASYSKQLEKLIQKKATEEEKSNLLQRQCQIEVSLKIWNETYDYLKSQNISLVENAKTCAEFVDGMLTNYKVE